MCPPRGRQAAVIAMPDDRGASAHSRLCHFAPAPKSRRTNCVSTLPSEFAKWQLPDRFEFVATIPCTATGKFKKTQLRDQFVSA